MQVQPKRRQNKDPISFEGWLERFLGEAAPRDGADLPGLRAWVDVAEAWRITRALRDARGNRSAAARTLGIGRRTLYAKMDRLGIHPVWASQEVWASRRLESP